MLQKKILEALKNYKGGYDKAAFVDVYYCLFKCEREGGFEFTFQHAFEGWLEILPLRNKYKIDLLDYTQRKYSKQLKEDEKEPERPYGEWFAVLHKAMRQTDFFQGQFVQYPVNRLTPDETTELVEVRKQMTDLINAQTDPKLDSWEKKRNIRTTHPELYKRYTYLIQQEKSDDKEPISGWLDRALHSLIQADKDGVLFELMDGVFADHNKSLVDAE